MSYEQILKEFVKNNIRILLSDPFPNNLYEKNKNEFFGKKLKHKYKRPKKKKVVKILMNLLINSIQSLEELNNFLEKPFIKNNLSEKDIIIYKEMVTVKKDEDIKIDIKKLMDDSYKQELKEKLKDEIIEEKTYEITKAIEEKQKEYYAIPSILDSIEMEEPDVFKEEMIFEEDEELIPWWRKLDLVSNPFPGNSLDKIDQKNWDKIVYKTSIFNKYHKYIESFPDELFKNIIFYGEYGSGKSTFFEYIQPSFIKNRIVPLYILLYGEDDAKSLQIKYEKKLLSELINTCHKLNIYSYSKIPDNIRETIDYLFDLIMKDGQRGIIIIIDELHKNPHLEPAMEFMNNLQSYTSELRKRKPILNAGIYLAGSYEWKHYIEKTPMFSGSFIESEDMPNINPEIAWKAINMRLKVYSRNPNNPKQIQKDAIKRAFDILISSYTPITFRYVIKYIVDEFKKNNFDILTFDTLSSEKRKLIRNLFDQNHVLNTRFDMLINGSKKIDKLKHKENIKLLIEQLIKLYIKKVLYDNDPRIKEYQFFYKRLSEVGLITKILDNYGLKWVVCKELTELNDEIIKEFGISLENYLIDIYYEDVEKEDIIVTFKDKYMSMLDELPDKISKNIINSLTNSVKIRIEIESIFTDVDKMIFLQDIDKRKDIRMKIIQSMNSLTRSLCLFEHINTKKIHEFWNEYWYLTDNIVRYERYIKNKEYYDQSIENHINITYLYQIYINSYDDIFTFVINQLKFSKYWRLPVSTLTKEEFTNFYNIRDLWMDGKYKQCLLDTSDLFENKLRIFIKNIFDIFYGDNYENYIDQKIKLEIQKRQKRNEEALLYEISEKSYYDYINRNNLISIIIDDNNNLINWNNLFSNIFYKYNKDDVKNILETLSNTNNYIRLLEDEFITIEQKEYIKTYVLNVINYVQIINLFYIKLLRLGKRYRDKKLGKNYIIFSFKELKKISDFERIEIGRDSEIIFEIIKSRKSLKNIPLDDSDHIKTYFNKDYRAVYAMLSLLSNIKESELKQFKLEGKINIITNRYGGATVDIEFNEIKAYNEVNNYSYFQSIIQEYKNLLKNNSEEPEFQDFFEKNPNFLDGKVIKYYPKKSFGGEAIPDFVLLLNDKTYLIVEIEKPNIKLFNKKGDPSSELTHAQQQIRDYISWAIEEKEFLRKRGCEDISESNIYGLLIIGDSNKLNKNEVKKLEKINAEVKNKYSIKTFDNVLKENEAILNNMRARKYRAKI
ncbi:MAG: hypothetical protein ACFFDN_20825 [Candidatus Hodarchaeota archaeon]